MHYNKWTKCAEVDWEYGVYSIPLRWREKAPFNKGWQNLRLNPDDYPNFIKHPCNRGRLLGIAPGSTKGGWVVCVDLDSEEARQLAEYFLPPTGEIAGRPSKQRAHYFYECVSPPKTRRFRDAANNTILDLLSTGTQVVVEPSIHPSGEPYRWDVSGDRGGVRTLELNFSSSVLAAVCLFIVSTESIKEFDELCRQLAGEIEDYPYLLLIEHINSLNLKDTRLLPSLFESQKRDGPIISKHNQLDVNLIVRRAACWLEQIQ